MSFEQITERAITDANRVLNADRPKVALDYLADALEADPRSYEALVLTAEIYSLYADDLDDEPAAAQQEAIGLFDRAIAIRPEDPEAYASKALSLLYLDRVEDAVACADLGLGCLSEPPTDGYLPVWTNIAETLYYVKSHALKRMRQIGEGRQVLAEGLRRFPGSEYLTFKTRAFLPAELDNASSDD
jgi:tetratricopeptide (TPR) repeat protein